MALGNFGDRWCSESNGIRRAVHEFLVSFERPCLWRSARGSLRCWDVCFQFNLMLVPPGSSTCVTCGQAIAACDLLEDGRRLEVVAD